MKKLRGSRSRKSYILPPHSLIPERFLSTDRVSWVSAARLWVSLVKGREGGMLWR